MESKPWVGAERDPQESYLCGFASSPESLHCNRDAAWHGIRFDIDGEMLSMECCDEHKPSMEALCDYVHQLTHPCGIPGSMFRWPENECYTEWFEQSEFTQVANTNDVVTPILLNTEA
jgi:hypothetical protein